MYVIQMHLSSVLSVELILLSHLSLVGIAYCVKCVLKESHLQGIYTVFEMCPNSVLLIDFSLNF